MKPAYLPEKPRRPQHWQELPLGENVRDAAETVLKGFCRQFFGYHLLQLGDLSSEMNLSACPIRHKIRQKTHQDAQAGLVSSAEELPYQENSLDVVVLAHELDFSRDPHQILREVDRVIIPDGHVVIIGYNPLSLANLTRFIPLKRSYLLRQARFFTAARIKDWLSLLGFDIVCDERRVFSSLLFSKAYSNNSKVQTFLQRYLSLFGSVYVIVAKKRESTLTLIKPKWRAKPKLAQVVSMPAGQANTQSDTP
ncbi:class I SAM-dependent methyltransferase [Bowmanella sp. JS7-9]|uniref:Class I SAM-dependent methyltransferase n=1 Tax=Pseudobowmanella zhangzhouensis TaxID=1537679 RepID=A0ABW1XMU8_9ALTE|nr:class I SAM-dependent methyltransferase [Bowmanella sp. JS7-9]TBX22629.1 hypothetical protein TK45_09395 [Bowmanella sp. JS7-9]